MKDLKERIIHIFPREQQVRPRNPRRSQGRYKEECKIPDGLGRLTNADILRSIHEERPDTPGERAVRDYLAGRKLLDY